MPCKTKELQTAYFKQHYAKNAESYKLRAKIWNTAQRKVLRHLLASVKASNACVDCGDYFEPFVMQFDHVVGSKSKDVSCMVSSACSIELVWDEISKCQVVCANCHHRRTYYRRGEQPF